MTSMRTLTGVAVLVTWLTATAVRAQNPKPPTSLPPEIQSVDQLPQDAVVLWIDGNNFTVYVDSTSNPIDQNKITTLEIKWEGPGPGFRLENYDWDDPACHTFVPPGGHKFAIIRTRGIGPIFVSSSSCWGEGVIPDGYLETWNPAESWIVDGSYLTGGTLDKFDANSPYFGPVPEPSSIAIGVLGAIALLLLRPPRH